MWEKLTIYKQLDKKNINAIFKKFGEALLSELDGYSLNQTNSVIKISRQTDELEQAIFIEKERRGYNLKISTCIKPIDFYKKHRYYMVNVVPLGDIMNNYRKTSYPLTQEWNYLAVHLAERINKEIRDYFRKYDSFNKIIDNRKDIEPKDFSFENKYELLIYAAIRTKNKSLLNLYIDKKLLIPAMKITQSEYLKPDSGEIDEVAFLSKIKELARDGDFMAIENEISIINRV